MITIDSALRACHDALEPLTIETARTVDALDRVLASGACYADDLPRFDQSAMDGYALRALDVAAASPEQPIHLPLQAIVAAGRQAPLGTLKSGAAMRIFTGAPLPSGADSIIPQERATIRNQTLVITEPWPAHRNIRWRGEEARAGTPLTTAGKRIGPGLLAALVNAGVAEVQLFRQPRIRVLITGDELRPSGEVLHFGEIVDSNGPLVHAILKRWGYRPFKARQVRDRADAVRRNLSTALDNADLVLTCGGTSVGDYDFLPETAEKLGVRKVFWKVAQKPGKPVFFGVRGNTALLALPGNPGAVLVNLVILGRMVLDRLEGAAVPGPTWAVGWLRHSVQHDARREQLLRMKLEIGSDGKIHLHPQPQQGSHMLGNLGIANVLVRVPVGSGSCPAGSALQWTPLPAGNE